MTDDRWGEVNLPQFGNEGLVKKGGGGEFIFAKKPLSRGGGENKKGGWGHKHSLLVSCSVSVVVTQYVQYIQYAWFGWHWGLDKSLMGGASLRRSHSNILSIVAILVHVYFSIYSLCLVYIIFSVSSVY